MVTQPFIVRLLIFLAGTFFISPAWATVIVINDGGALDPGGDEPNQIVADSFALIGTDRAGQESTGCLEVTVEDGYGEVYMYPVHEEGLQDVSAASNYVNFYFKVVNGDLVWQGVWLFTNEACTNGMGWFENDPIYGANSNWHYISLPTDVPDDELGTPDFNTLSHVGIGFEGTGTLRLDHFTFSSIPEEGELTAFPPMGGNEGPMSVPSGAPIDGATYLALLISVCATCGALALRG